MRTKPMLIAASLIAAGSLCAAALRPSPDGGPGAPRLRLLEQAGDSGRFVISWAPPDTGAARVALYAWRVDRPGIWSRGDSTAGLADTAWLPVDTVTVQVDACVRVAARSDGFAALPPEVCGPQTIDAQAPRVSPPGAPMVVPDTTLVTAWSNTGAVTWEGLSWSFPAQAAAGDSLTYCLYEFAGAAPTGKSAPWLLRATHEDSVPAFAPALGVCPDPPGAALRSIPASFVAMR